MFERNLWSVSMEKSSNYKINNFTITIPEYPLMCKLCSKIIFGPKMLVWVGRMLITIEYKQLIQHYMLWETLPWRQALSEDENGINLSICIKLTSFQWFSWRLVRRWEGIFMISSHHQMQNSSRSYKIHIAKGRKSNVNIILLIWQ